MAYPGAFDDLPRSYQLSGGMGTFAITGNAANLSSGIAATLPSDVAQCHTLLRALDAERQRLLEDQRRLQQELAGARTTIAELAVR